MGKYDEPEQAVIFDMDGTLADCEHRRHFVEGKKKYFDKFYDAMDEDTTNSVICGLCNMYFMNNWHVIICTGRPESYRNITEKWLKDHGVFYKELMMRPNDRKYDPDFEVKQTMLDEILKDRKVHAAIDDRNQVVNMWRRNGITCMQVADGGF